SPYCSKPVRCAPSIVLLAIRVATGHCQRSGDHPAALGARWVPRSCDDLATIYESNELFPKGTRRGHTGYRVLLYRVNLTRGVAFGIRPAGEYCLCVVQVPNAVLGTRDESFVAA